MSAQLWTGPPCGCTQAGHHDGCAVDRYRPTAATVPAARAAWEHLAAAGLLDVTARTTLMGLVEGVPDDLRRADA